VSERATYDAEADAAYFPVAPRIGAGESVENVVIDRPFGTLILDFDDAGRLLGLEVVGARSLLTEATIDQLSPLR
jgi:uncharacterized protein YuzE